MPITKHYNACAPQCCTPAAPTVNTSVISVNGQTGVVKLNAMDVSAIPQPQNKLDGGYLQWKNGSYVLNNVVAESDAEFDSELHLLII